MNEAGKALVAQFYQALADADVEAYRFATKWKIMCADEQRVVAFMESDGKAVNGERYNQRYCQVFGFRDGKIAEVFEFFDSTLAQRALWDNRLANSERPPQLPFEF